MKLPRKIWEAVRNRAPIRGFRIERPIVVLQSDDWGRAGIRDREDFERLRSKIADLGDRPYDLYSLETAEDLASIRDLLRRHHDSTGQSPTLGMNFIVANLDLKKMASSNFRDIQLLPLADGLPDGWNRAGLFEGYREGIREGLFSPALHGTTHFCRSAVEPCLDNADERGTMLRLLWENGTPYIYSRMQWIGYEYWNPGRPQDERFESAEVQHKLIGQAVGAFAKLFSGVPRSACAPGYRANGDTHRSWAQYGIEVAQNGPRGRVPPHIDRCGLLQLYRTVEFEPAVAKSFSVDACVRAAEESFALGIPAIVSMHSINFHSTLKDFRSVTLQALDEFLSILESKHAALLYLRDEDVHDLVVKGSYENASGLVRVKVGHRIFSKSGVLATESVS